MAALAARINRHLCRHTPGNRFATAAFLVLDHASGTLTYANAGHNPPILAGGGSSAMLDPTGMALGWFEDATYDTRIVTMTPGATLLLYTDGLPDAIGSDDPERRLRDVLTEHPTLAAITGLVDPTFNEDDVTMLLVSRKAAA